jgi:hypothetical protein
MPAQQTFTPSFKVFKLLTDSLKAAMPAAPDMASALKALKHLQASASQQDEGAFLVQTQGFLNHLKSGIEAIDFGSQPAIAEHLEKLFSTFGDFIQDAEPKLAADIKAALEGNEKKDALLKLLDVDKDNKDKTFAAALAPHLKALLTPSHLSRREHRDAIQDRMSESLGELHQRVADQGIYDPEKAPWLYFFKLLFNLVEMVSSPPLRSSVQKDDPHAPKTIRIPMK